MPKKRRGVTLAEILVAIAVLAIGMGAAMHVFFSVFGSQRKALAREQSINLARSLLDNAINGSQKFFIYENTSPARWSYYTTSGTMNANYYFPLVFSDFNPQLYTSYTSLPTGFPASGDDYSSYYYRFDIRPVSDPDLLYYDNLCFRITSFVTVPPLNPTVQGWGMFSHACTAPYQNCRTCERSAINRGYIIVLSSFSTLRQTFTYLMDAEPTINGAQRYSVGDQMLYVRSNASFAAFNRDSDGIASPDKDYYDAYSLPLTGTYQSTFPAHTAAADQGNYNAVIIPKNNGVPAPYISNISYNHNPAFEIAPTVNSWNNETPGTSGNPDADFNFYDPDTNATVDRFDLQSCPEYCYQTSQWQWIAPTSSGGNDGIVPFYERRWWEKIQVIGLPKITVGSDTVCALRVYNPRADAVRQNRNGLYFPYEYNQFIRPYMFLRLNYP